MSEEGEEVGHNKKIKLETNEGFGCHRIRSLCSSPKKIIPSSAIYTVTVLTLLNILFIISYFHNLLNI